MMRKEKNPGGVLTGRGDQKRAGVLLKPNRKSELYHLKVERKKAL